MRKTMKQLLAGGGIVALAALALPGAGGAAPPPPGTLQTFADPLPRLPPSPTQRMAESVGQMSQRIQRDIGAIYPGEDALGTGTSITH